MYILDSVRLEIKQAAARHENAYLVNREKSEFLASDGDKRWLQGLEFAPKKLRDLNEINKILAHRPWQMTAAHIEKLTKGTEENWSLSEVVHAIVILAHFHSLSSFVWSSGITAADDHDDNEENMSKNQAAFSGVTSAGSDVDDVKSAMGAASEVQTPGRKSSTDDSDDLHPKGINIISNKSGNSIVSVGVNTDPVSVLVGPRTGQDSPPLDPHPGSPPNEASVEVSLLFLPLFLCNCIYHHCFTLVTHPSLSSFEFVFAFLFFIFSLRLFALVSLAIFYFCLFGYLFYS